MLRYRFEILLPIYHNDGNIVDIRKIKNAKRQIINEFGGCRATTIPLVGHWQSAGIEYKDKVKHITVETEKSDDVIDWFKAKKAYWESKAQFDQVLIYITYHELKLVE